MTPTRLLLLKTWLVFACLYVFRVEKGKVVKNPQTCGLVGFHGPPTVGINWNEGVRGGGHRGWCCNIKKRRKRVTGLLSAMR